MGTSLGPVSGDTTKKKQTQISMIRKPQNSLASMEQTILQTMDSITPGADTGLESAKRLLGIEDDSGDQGSGIKTESLSGSTAKVDTVLEFGSEPAPVPTTAVAASRSKATKELKSKVVSAPTSVSPSSGDYVYNLKINLLPEEADLLEIMCLKIRSEIRQKKRRKQLVGLQTLAQHLFDKMVSDEKFRVVVHTAMVESMLTSTN